MLSIELIKLHSCEEFDEESLRDLLKFRQHIEYLSTV